MDCADMDWQQISSEEGEFESFKALKKRVSDYRNEDATICASADVDEAAEFAIHQTKRFKCAKSDISNTCPKSLVRAVNICNQPKEKAFRHAHLFDGVCIMSPITEITTNLSETKLKSPSEDLVDIPCKIWTNSQEESRRNTALAQISSERGVTTTPLSRHNSKQSQKPNRIIFSLSQNSHSSRRLNLNESQHEMVVEDICFYDDNSARQSQNSQPSSPQILRILSPETSPRRFQIVEKNSCNKFLQPQQKPQNAVGSISTKSSNNTSAKGFRIFHSLSSGSMESSMDDEYMELFEMEALEQQQSTTDQLDINFPSNLNSLISGQIKNSSPANGGILAKTPEMRRPSVRRCLSLTDNQPKTPEYSKQAQETATTPFSMRLTADRSNTTISSTNSCFKRPEPPSTISSPIHSKRYRGEEKENLTDTSKEQNCHASDTTSLPIPRPLLRKCVSMNDAEIMSALTRLECKDQPDLIGDFTKPFVLPIMGGRHPDLKSISSETVARLIKGEFSEDVANFEIIDCRYPYEYDGGHIQGAKNIYTQEQIIEEFLIKQKTESKESDDGAPNNNKRNIIIFHCEFSSERGPKLSRFLRNNDRARNTNTYPTLDYPEIYLLHNGYKEFYETHSELCNPIAYRPMLEPSFTEAYRHFRAKSKSWNGDSVGGTMRQKKSRSRLLL